MYWYDYSKPTQRTSQSFAIGLRPHQNIPAPINGFAAFGNHVQFGLAKGLAVAFAVQNVLKQFVSQFTAFLVVYFE